METSMYDPRYPYPPPAPKPGFPVWAIVLLVVGGLAVVGGIGVVIVGALVVGAVSESAKKDDPWTSSSTTTTPTTPTTPATPPPATTLAANDDEPDEPTEPTEPTDTSAKSGSSGATPATTPKPTSGKWFCNATGWARICGFANVCNNMMFSGIGSGPDQLSASMMAKNACQGSMRARGGTGVCTAACSMK